MIGVALDVDAWPLVEAGYERGVLLLNAGPRVLRLLPPLIVEETHIEELIAVLGELLAEQKGA